MSLIDGDVMEGGHSCQPIFNKKGILIEGGAQRRGYVCR